MFNSRVHVNGSFDFVFSLGCSGDEQDLSVKATAVCSVYEKPILVNKPLHKGTLES